MIHRKQKMQGTLVAEFRDYVKIAEQPAAFIDEELLPYADAYEEVTDKAFQSYVNADQIGGNRTSSPPSKNSGG